MTPLELLIRAFPVLAESVWRLLRAVSVVVVWPLKFIPFGFFSGVLTRRLGRSAPLWRVVFVWVVRLGALYVAPVVVDWAWVFVPPAWSLDPSVHWAVSWPVGISLVGIVWLVTSWKGPLPARLVRAVLVAAVLAVLALCVGWLASWYLYGIDLLDPETLSWLRREWDAYAPFSWWLAALLAALAVLWVLGYAWASRHPEAAVRRILIAFFFPFRLAWAVAPAFLFVLTVATVVADGPYAAARDIALWWSELLASHGLVQTASIAGEPPGWAWMMVSVIAFVVLWELATGLARFAVYLLAWPNGWLSDLRHGRVRVGSDGEVVLESEGIIPRLRRAEEQDRSRAERRLAALASEAAYHRERLAALDAKGAAGEGGSSGLSDPSDRADGDLASEPLPDVLSDALSSPVEPSRPAGAASAQPSQPAGAAPASSPQFGLTGDDAGEASGDFDGDAFGGGGLEAEADEIERRKAEHHERIQSDRRRREEEEEREREAVRQAELDDLVGHMGLPDASGSMRAIEEMSDMDRGEEGVDDLPLPFDDEGEDADEPDPYEVLDALVTAAHAAPGDASGSVVGGDPSVPAAPVAPAVPAAPVVAPPADPAPPSAGVADAPPKPDEPIGAFVEARYDAHGRIRPDWSALRPEFRDWDVKAGDVTFVLYAAGGPTITRQVVDELSELACRYDMESILQEGPTVRGHYAAITALARLHLFRPAESPEVMRRRIDELLARRCDSSLAQLVELTEHLLAHNRRDMRQMGHTTRAFLKIARTSTGDPLDVPPLPPSPPATGDDSGLP